MSDTYDDLSHLLSVTHRLGAITADGATYSYDDAIGSHTGYHQSKTNLLSASTSNYDYDPIYELAGGADIRFLVSAISRSDLF